MAEKNASKNKPSTKSASSDKKSSPKVKDLSPRKDPRGGSTDHSPKKGDY